MAQLFSLGRFALMNILSLVALSLMFVVGALFLLSVFALKICVQRFAGFIKRPYWLLFFVSLGFMVPPIALDLVLDHGQAMSLFDIIMACAWTCGAIGFAVSLCWMVIAGVFSFSDWRKHKH